MAEVDFSNAVLDVTSGGKTPWSCSSYLGFTATSTSLRIPLLLDANKTRISLNETMNVLTSTPTNASIVFTGSFQTSGTEFWFGARDNSSQQLNWHVSNISFNAGDTYNFRIDIETVGNS